MVWNVCPDEPCCNQSLRPLESLPASFLTGKRSPSRGWLSVRAKVHWWGHGAWGGENKTSFDGEERVSVEPEKGFDTASFLFKGHWKDVQSIANHCFLCQGQVFEMFCPSPGRRRRKTQQYTWSPQANLSFLCCTHLVPVFTLEHSLVFLPSPPAFCRVCSFQIYRDHLNAGGAAWRGKQLRHSHMSLLPSRHFNDLHAARKARLTANFAQFFSGSVVWHDALPKLHLAASALKLLLERAFLVPAPPGVTAITLLCPPAHSTGLVTARGQLTTAVGRVSSAVPIDGRGRVEMWGLGCKIPAVGKGRSWCLRSQYVRVPAFEAQPRSRLCQMLLAGGETKQEVRSVVVFHAAAPVEGVQERALGGGTATGSPQVLPLALAVQLPGGLGFLGRVCFLFVRAGFWALLRDLLDRGELTQLAAAL